MSSTSSDEETVVILDNGSHKIKAGYAGDDAPRIVFRTVVGRPLYEGQTLKGKRIKNHYVGDEAMSRVDVLVMSNPIERGIVTNWDDMEKVWQRVFNDLHVVPWDQRIVVTEPPLNTKANKEKLAQVMFETFRSPAVHLVCSSLLSLYASGRGSGIVVDSGYELTHVMCIYEGHAISQSVLRSDIGGNDITNYLIELLGKQGYSFTTMQEREEVSSLKERCSYVSLEPKLEQLDKVKKDYTIFGDNIISVGYERFQCQEAMFKPELMGIDAPGIHELIVNSIQACPVDIHAVMFCNIILTGSNTMTAGLGERIKKEIATIVHTRVRMKVVAPPERKCSTWIGGSILGSLSIQPAWVTKGEYDEFGPTLVHKCSWDFR